MAQPIQVTFRYQEVDNQAQGCVVVVVDVLRATTTITTAFDHGARAVLTVADLEQAYAFKQRDPAVLLGGERNNLPPPGFDGGNSPFDYPPERVNRQRLVFTTSNGTQAVAAAAKSEAMALGCLLNASACAQWLSQFPYPAVIVAAGSQGAVSLDDVLTAGAIVAATDPTRWSDSAKIAVAVYASWRHNLMDGLSQARHGQTLIRQGLVEDIRWAARLNVTRTLAVRGADGWFYAQSIPERSR